MAVYMEGKDDGGDFTIIENSMAAQNKYRHCYGSETYLITREEIQALLDGKQLASTVNGNEHSIFIILKED